MVFMKQNLGNYLSPKQIQNFFFRSLVTSFFEASLQDKSNDCLGFFYN